MNEDTFVGLDVPKSVVVAAAVNAPGPRLDQSKLGPSAGGREPSRSGGGFLVLRVWLGRVAREAVNLEPELRGQEPAGTQEREARQSASFESRGVTMALCPLARAEGQRAARTITSLRR